MAHVCELRQLRCNQTKPIAIIWNLNQTYAAHHRVLHQPTQYHMAVRSSCNPPANTVPHGGQIIMQSTSQHSTTWRSDHHAIHQPTQYHMAVRSSCNPPANTVPHGGQIIMQSTSQHNATWRSDHAIHQPTQYHMAVRSSCNPPANTVPHGGLIESLWGMRLDSKLSSESSVENLSVLSVLFNRDPSYGWSRPPLILAFYVMLEAG